MPSQSQSAQGPSSRGRWRQRTVWEIVEPKRRRNASTGKAGNGSSTRPSPASHSSYAAAAASANGSRKVTIQGDSSRPGSRGARTEWTVEEWNDWTAGGWRKGQSSKPDSGDGDSAAAAPRDEDRDATTAEIRQELLEVQALRAQHGRSKNPCPEIGKMLDDKAAALRLRLDNNKLPSDLYALDRKKLAQLQDRADKLLEQNTQTWAEIEEAVKSAKERDRRYLAIMAQIEELEATLPARAEAAGIKPPQPEVDSAMEIFQRQVDKDTAVATSASCDRLTEIMRAANVAMQEVHAQLAAAQNVKQDIARAAAPTRMDVDPTGAVATDNNSALNTTTTTTTTTGSTSAEPDAQPATHTPAAAAAEQAAEPFSAAASSAAAGSSTGIVTIPEGAGRDSIKEKAHEASTARDGDAEAVSTARAALRARLSQQPDDYEWLQRGTQLVSREIAKHQKRMELSEQATGAGRTRSRSRSAGSKADNDEDDL